MKCYISVVCVLSALLAVTLAAPLEESAIEPIHNQVKRQTSTSSTNNNQQETLNRVIAFSNQKLQLLRRLCPQLFQVIDLVIQNVTSQVFRVVGGALLRSGGLGGGGSSSGGGSSGGGRVSVVLPTFPPDEDEDEDDDEEEDVDIRSRSNITTSTTSAIALSVDLTSTTMNNEIEGNAGGSSTMVSISSSSSSTSSESPTTLGSSTEGGGTPTSTPTPTPTSSEPFTSPSLVSDSNTVKRHIRRPRAAEDDQEGAASGGNGPDPAEDLSNVDTDDTDRNKRYLPFGGDGHASGGSGNFLFDLVRNTADRAARTIGTVYRMVAGTENLGFGVTATSTSSKTVATAPASQLVAGSGVSEEADEKDAGVGGVAEVDVQPKSGDGEGIPGPITRLLVIANRGIANLIQDLILRLPQPLKYISDKVAIKSPLWSSG